MNSVGENLIYRNQLHQQWILKDNSKAKQWIEVLKAGGSKNPVDLAKMADVDITTDKPLLNTIEYIGSLIDELEKLTDKIEKE